MIYSSTFGSKKMGGLLGSLIFSFACLYAQDAEVEVEDSTLYISNHTRPKRFLTH